MLRFGLTAIALFGLLAASANVQAGALDSLLTPNLVRDRLEDDDFESIVDMTGDGLGVGDVFVGVFRLQRINGTDLADVPGVGGVKGIIVAAIDTFNSTTGYMTFRAVTTGAGSEYASLIAGNVGTGGVGLSNLPSISAGAALIVYETDDANLAAIDDTVPTGSGLATRYTAINDNIEDAQGITGSPAGGSLAYEFGFTDNAFAEASLTDSGLNFRLALNVVSSPIGIFLKNISSSTSGINKLGVSLGGTGGALPNAKIHISGTGDLVVDNGVDDFNPFDLQTDANMYVNAYPEPGSMVLLTLGGLGIAGAKLRRRKNAA